LREVGGRSRDVRRRVGTVNEGQSSLEFVEPNHVVRKGLRQDGDGLFAGVTQR
jgi:hypothetical protein